jgi:hypothetical protein
LLISVYSFVGFMYLAAFLCLWFLKAWKIGEMERLAALEEKPTDSIDPVTSNGESHVLRDEEARVKPRSSFVKRMLIWRKV